MIRCFVLLGMIAAAPPLCARDVFVLLSGGVSPFDNNYSQYLQARGVNAYFEKNYSRDSVWTFFGAGNVAGEKPIVADVRRKILRDGVLIDTWLPGAIPHNRPATREVILKAFREEILPAIANGGTLFLFVGDHGSQKNRDGESEIDLWELKPDSRNDYGWRYTTNASLGVAEFRRVLASGMGKGRVVFCMTQCHAGGFHSIAIPEEMTMNPRWLNRSSRLPAAKSDYSFPRAAGFTATDQFSAAAGCMSNPDEKSWAGYERFIPENLFGMDLLEQQQIRPAMNSFAEAHVAATLQDFTIDKPSSTSEEFLERWASLLDSKLSESSQLTYRARSALENYRRTVDGVWSKVSDAAFRERQKQFAQFIQKMSEQNVGVHMLLATGTRRQLEDAAGFEREPNRRDSFNLNSMTNRPARRPQGRGGSSETRRLWRDAIRPAWSEAVNSGAITNRISLPLEFESYLLQRETNDSRIFLTGGRALDEEAYWFSGYVNPETLDPQRAEVNARWVIERRSTILDWAMASDDDDVREAGMKISLRRRGSRSEDSTREMASERDDKLSRETAAERTLFYRRVLGAWEFLLKMNERPALAKLRELTELERTPFPPSTK